MRGIRNIPKKILISLVVPENCWFLIECIEACLDLNLNCKIDGDVGGVCVSQDYAIGDTVYAGEIIHVTLVKDAVVDETETDETAPAEDGSTGEDGMLVDMDLPPDEEDGEG